MPSPLCGLTWHHTPPYTLSSGQTWLPYVVVCGVGGGGPALVPSLCLGAADRKTALGVFSCECLFRDCNDTVWQCASPSVRLSTRVRVLSEVPWGNGVRVLAVQIAGVYLLLLSPSCLFSWAEAQAPGRDCSQKSCPFPWHLALRALGGPYLLWLERDRPRQVHKLTFPPPLSFWGQAGSLRPRGRAGPPGSGPPTPPPSSWSGPPRAVIG